MSGRYGDSTRSLKAVNSQAVSGQPVAPQPVLAATYHLSADETLDGYGRGSNPTWRQLESALAELEGAAGAVVFGSGMAAVSAVLRAWAPPGSTVVVPADGYYQVRRHATEDLALAGVTVVAASSSQIYDAAAQADVVLAETPTNPALDVVDLHRLATICHGRGARLVVDNTAATPLGQQPLSLGADAVVASATKALSGHSDLLAGYVATSQQEYSPPPSANACSPARSWAGSRRGFCCAAWKLPDCDSSANARTPGRWRRCWPAIRRCGPCATRGWRRIRRIPSPWRRCADSAACSRSNWPTPRRCTPSSRPAAC